MQQPGSAVSSLGNLALGMCHRSLLFARNPQRTFSAAVNTTWQGFIGMWLAANTPLGTFLSQVSAGTNDGFTLHHRGQSLVRLVLFAAFC